MLISQLRRLLAIVALPVVAASCTNSLELDRFRMAEASSVDTAIAVSYFDVRFGARGMTSHLGEYLEVRVVDKQNHVQAKAIYSDVTGPDFSLYLGRIVPKASPPYRLDFWADHNNTSRYDGIEGGINEKDHAWRRVLADPLPEDMRLEKGRYDLEFVHDTAFVDIATDLQGNPVSEPETLLPFQMKIVNGGAYVGKSTEIRVIDKTSTRLVAFHRQGRMKAEYTAKVTGLLDEETLYEVSVYVDLNDSGKFDAGDPSWKLDLTSDSAGLVTELDVAKAPQAPIETGEP
jgi:hypothetical protein